MYSEWIGGENSGKKQFRQKDTIYENRQKYLWFCYEKNKIDSILYLAEFALSLPGFLAAVKRTFFFFAKNNINTEESDENISDFRLLNIKWNLEKEVTTLWKLKIIRSYQPFFLSKIPVTTLKAESNKKILKYMNMYQE